MSIFIKRGMSTLLAVLMALSTGIPAFAEEVSLEEPTEIILEEEPELYASSEESLEDIIRPQIEAYAKSIDQKDADKKAQDTLINHGMFGKGKKLSVGENHVITAALMNSELIKEAIPNFLVALLNARKEYGTDEIYGCLGTNWYVSGKREYYILLYDYDYKSKIRYDSEGNWFAPSDYLNKPTEFINVEKTNGYDKTLILIVGGMGSHIDVKTNKVYDNRTVYDVSVCFHDMFNFDTDNSTALENILGFIGLLLFNPYDWEASCSFQIEVLNNCEHSYESVVKEPNCTEKGSATYTCTLCGYSYTEENPAKGHSLGEWSVYAKPIVGKAGEERRACANCDYYESKEIAAYRYGDVNCDGKVNTIDANYVRRYAAGLLILDERQLLAADVDGENGINVIDASLIRRYTVKLINAFPKEAAE